MLQRVSIGLCSRLRTAIDTGDSPDRLACTIALAAYVAFCPFLGFHTLLVIFFSWSFGLSMPVMLLVSNLINNPWTIVPVYASGYACGQWILGSLLGQDTLWYNPSWMNYFNGMLTSILGLPQVSLLSFLVGGNSVGILVGLLVYPVARMCILRARISRHNHIDCGVL